MSSAASSDEFQALEERVLRTVEMVKQQREARAAAESELGRAREELATMQRDSERRDAVAGQEREASQRQLEALQGQLDALHGERETVRRRVEKLLAQMDELG